MPYRCEGKNRRRAESMAKKDRIDNEDQKVVGGVESLATSQEECPVAEPLKY